MKKFLTLILAGLLIFTLAACGAEDAPVQSNDGDVNNTTSSDRSDISYDQSMNFNGYKIRYPEGAGTDMTGYGELIDSEDLVLLIEAPSTVGIMLDVASVEEAPSVCEKYLIHTLENRFHYMFTSDATEQTILESEVVTNNGIEMLRVEGVVKDTYENTETKYVGYYFLSNSGYPIYIIGFPTKETDASVAEFVDGIAANITK